MAIAAWTIGGTSGGKDFMFRFCLLIKKGFDNGLEEQCVCLNSSFKIKSTICARHCALTHLYMVSFVCAGESERQREERETVAETDRSI